MTHAKEQKNWRDHLPSILSWLDKASINYETKEVQGAYHVVPVSYDDKNQTGVFHTTGLSSHTCENLEKLSKQWGWSFSGGPLALTLNGSYFFLVPESKLSVSKAQRGRQLGLDVATNMRQLDIQTLVFCGSKDLDPGDVFDGFIQSCYSLNTFKNGNNKVDKLPSNIVFLGNKHTSSQQDFLRAQIKATVFTRMLADLPPNYLNSERFAEIAQDISSDFGLKCSVKGREEIFKMGMGAFHSVAKGTTVDPKLITIEIEGNNPKQSCALVGKGLTFDSGGISLKQSQGMDEMKYDMCGGAAVLGAAYFFGHVKPPVNVVCVIGAVENMPGREASRPGDIVTAMNGKTIEILNTDAEGRLVLADLLHYTRTNYKPQFMIDVATLTGAVIFALGHMGAALMSNSQDLADHLKSVSDKVGEPMWQLPMWPEVPQEIKSKVADYKNIANTTVRAGTVVAGAFLQEFVGDTQWAHLDIAGTAWNCKATGFNSKGGSAYALKTMVQACLECE